ncbi:MAG: peptidylprolyl isomerase [Planctomycetaceae bacterium]
MKSPLRITCLILVCSTTAVTAADDSGKSVVASVNDTKITQADLEAEYLVRRIPADKQALTREAVLNDLIDRRLIAEFLDNRKAPIPEPELDARMDLLKRAVEAGKGSFAETIGRLGLTEDSLRAHLALPLRWRSFVRNTVTDQELRSYFDARRAELDGTQVHIRQIVISVPAGSEEATWAAAETKLKEVRQSITDKKVSFEDAARQHSTSPSGKQGGDLGWMTYRGRLPAALLQAAFALKPGELSDVIRTPFGMHLVQITERKPGEYSLEDVREQVWEQRTQEFWNQQVAEARKTARIKIVQGMP